MSIYGLQSWNLPEQQAIEMKFLRLLQIIKESPYQKPRNQKRMKHI